MIPHLTTRQQQLYDWLHWRRNFGGSVETIIEGIRMMNREDQYTCAAILQCWEYDSMEPDLFLVEGITKKLLDKIIKV